jgi:hypothetical protein
MSQHHHHRRNELEATPTPAEHPDLHLRLSLVAEQLAELKDAMARNFAAGEIERFSFNGKTGMLQVTDDHGSNALSYAVYNPNNFRVFVGLAGTSASTDGLIVPKQKLVVAPLQINGRVQLAADATELGEGSGTILRVRFPMPQPFFVGDLA